MEPVRLGVLGVGWFGAELARAVSGSDFARVVSCFARSVGARRRFAETFGGRAPGRVEELLSDPEVEGVLIATPHSTHASLIEQAAGAGKHVFVEKPLALTVAEARRAIAAAERAGVVLGVGHNRRRQPANRRIKSMVEAGDFGTVLQLEANYCVPGGHRLDLPAWRSDPAEVPAGSMTPLGVHMVDTFHYFVGRATRVSAFSKRVRGFRLMDEATTVILEYETGPLGYVGTSYYAPPVTTLAVYGTKLNAWNEEDGARLFLQRRGEPHRAELPVETEDTVLAELREFASCIREGGTPETGGEEGLAVVAVLEAVTRSVSSGRGVEVSTG